MAPTVAVVGGGISGLAACYHLSRGPRPPKVLLLEAGARLGGWLQSTRAADGAVFEHGPRGIRPGGAAGADTLHMVSELGLAGAVLPVPGDHPASRNRFLYVAGALHKLPSGLGLFQAERSRRSVLLGLALGSGDGNGAESGLSRRARTERWSQWSLRGGMETLPQALAEFLRERGVELRCHQRLQSLRRCHHGGWELTLTDGTVTADHVVSALPAAALAEVLPAEAAALAQELRHIPAVSVAVVNLQYKDVTLPVTGFGHLVPSSEDGSLLGIVYDSVAFPEHNGTGAASLRLTVMLGGAWFEQSFGDPATVAPELLLHRAQAAVREQLGLEPAPTHSIVRVHQACIPQYTLGHWQRTGKWVLRSGGAPDAPSPVPSTHPGPTERISRFLAEHHLPLSLIGASYSGVSVNDCIASAKAAVERLLGPRH
ncbi:protoporphyrinogen oxidase isoform X3 [Melopsittacus undulatus]|uniref:protoporphyrinogen oxidase isoform X3 n=1 Tax=Melopsittacus undulatus TaxID=13146 RepID=UPI00146D593C|nr:protoporphyrinogen oxidase isoform X3 [Melopsittacus undulatus]